MFCKFYLSNQWILPTLGCTCCCVQANLGIIGCEFPSWICTLAFCVWLDISRTGMDVTRSGCHDVAQNSIQVFCLEVAFE
jgi:hypothetical protein